jgi:hypothetical protein
VAKDIDIIHKKLSERNQTHNGKPEHCMLEPLPFSILLTVGIFIYPYMAQYVMQWIVPGIGAAIFAMRTLPSF